MAESPLVSATHANAISTPVIGMELTNEKQQTALQRLREMVDEQFKDGVKLTKHGLIPKDFAGWCDDACLCRFLRANSWKVTNSFNQLMETLAWRRDYKVDDISPYDIEKQLRVGKMYLKGHDKGGRPILYTKKRVENTENIDFELQTKQLVYMMEKAIRLMKPGNETWVWIVDLNGYSMSNSAPMDVTKRLLHILATCYPERLYKCFLVDAPWIFSTLWKIVSPCLDPVTKAKIHWVEGSAADGSKKQKTFLEFIDADQLEMGYGGTLDFQYDFEKEDGQFKSLREITFSS
eukprot:TRINITY_DN7059_c0_g1_i1.p1 TRINITY_DN7059_c0_g1~~TRINITY_DN7059_c0_g1_i1.p1  ORF type:complete len:292 (+),score=74.03 TRINITY_DN7059_c0_g1_i1:242-1117(+)